MATGFSVMDALNKNSKAGIEETPKARFRTKDISIFKMYRNEMNFYSIAAVEELAGDILTFGLKQNLELVYEPCEKGEYRIVAGERRWLALKHLVSKGYKEFEMATSKLTTPQDADEEQVEIIIANAYRNKSVADMIEEEKRLKESLEKMKAAGKQIKGYDLTSGRLRDVIASMLHMSKTKVAQIESVNNNLIPEFKEELKSERLTFSAAYELSGMSEQEQQEALERFKESGELSHKDIKTMKGEKTGQQDTQKPAGEDTETATEGQNGSEPEKSTPETETGENGANTKPEESGEDSGNGDGQQDTQKPSGEGAETATEGQNGSEPEKNTPETETGENGANTKPEESETIIPQGTMRVTVICDGTLNLRRSAEWGNENICGRAARGQSYYVKAIHTVQGKKMVQTIDDIYLSGQSEHVQFEQL